ncbi:MAG: hypothetical protein MSIBF_02185 [Candidatus Altiarchaeales archaeon IMC4]|nr:MAG: hypothetical protein MSIBF_02185 [Candidatus Altiarchaeales archaeon IMC4]
MKTILIINGHDKIRETKKHYEDQIQKYNNIVKEITKGYFLREQTSKKGKLYKYWYKWIWDGKQMHHKYIGREKPEFNLPEKPHFLFSGLKYQVAGNDIVISEEEYKKIKTFFYDYQIFFVMEP